MIQISRGSVTENHYCTSLAMTKGNPHGITDLEMKIFKENEYS